MAKHKAKTNLYIVLVDAHQAALRYQSASRGSGRWCVCAKNEREAKEALAARIGNTHGSIQVYYEVKKDSAEYERYKHLNQNECEKCEAGE